MKLCRFELNDAPGQVKSGIVHGGKLYETEGTQPVAIYEADQVKLLSPIGLVPSVRLAGYDWQPSPIEPVDPSEVFYWYGNPSAIFGPNRVLELPQPVARLSFRPYLAAITASDAQAVEFDQGDEYLLGFTIVNVFVSVDLEQEERRFGFGKGRSSDLGIAIGPVLTTPDEFDDVTVSDEFGRRFAGPWTAKVNGVEMMTGSSEMVLYTASQLLSAASYSAPVRSGEILALGPVFDAPIGEFPTLKSGDTVEVSGDKLGTLKTFIA